MILRDQGDTLRVVTQTDHAHWAYLLLTAWPALAEHPRRAAILQATRQHDRGWQGIDASPVIDQRGHPHDFRTLPASLREDVWKQTVEATNWPTDVPTTLEGAMDLWAELLIAQHAWRIHRPGPSSLPGSSGRGDEWLPLAAALGAERRRRIEWIEHHTETVTPLLRLNEPEKNLEHDDSWVRTLDYLSLMICHGWEDPREFVVETPETSGETRRFRFHAQFASGRLILSPNPLKGTIRVPLRCRVTEKRSYASDSEFALALARSSWIRESIAVGPPPNA